MKKFINVYKNHILKKLNFKFKWKHTGRDFFLESFYHKGYWFYGKDREKEELKILNQLIKKGDSVLEVGTHIGYLSQVFENLIGSEGSLLLIEPTPKVYSF